MEDIIQVIFTHLSASDYESALLINKQWNKAVLSESLWKYLFFRNFYNTSLPTPSKSLCDLPTNFKSWKLFYIHVHKHYMNCERKPRYHFIPESEYSDDGFWDNPDGGMEQLLELVSDSQGGDIVVVEHLSACTEDNLTSYDTVDETIVGFFVFNGTCLEEFTFDYIDEAIGEYGVVKYPLHYWSWYLDMSDWQIDDLSFLSNFDLSANATVSDGRSRTWFLHNYVRYELYADRVVEDWENLRDYYVSVGLDLEGDYPSGYRTMYLKVDREIVDEEINEEEHIFDEAVYQDEDDI